jgi:hypothetical protein
MQPKRFSSKQISSLERESLLREVYDFAALALLNLRYLGIRTSQGRRILISNAEIWMHSYICFRTAIICAMDSQIRPLKRVHCFVVHRNSRLWGNQILREIYLSERFVAHRSSPGSEIQKFEDIQSPPEFCSKSQLQLMRNSAKSFKVFQRCVECCNPQFWNIRTDFICCPFPTLICQLILISSFIGQKSRPSLSWWWALAREFPIQD